MTYKEWEQIGFASKEDAWNASRKEFAIEMLESYGQSARDGGIAAEDCYAAIIERFEFEVTPPK